MHSKACTGMILSQFDLCKEMYLSSLFSKVKLTPTSKLVLIALANHYNPKNADMYPSIEYMASHLGISPRSVSSAVKDLSKAGLVIYETKKINRYKFTQLFFNILIKNKPEKSVHNTCKNNTYTHANFSNKQIIEQTNNKQVFSKNKFNNPSKRVLNNNTLSKRPYEHFNHLTGIQYKPYKATELIKDDKTPMNDKETAIKFISSFNDDDLKNTFIKKQVEKIKNKWKF